VGVGARGGGGAAAAAGQAAVMPTTVVPEGAEAQRAWAAAAAVPAVPAMSLAGLEAMPALPGAGLRPSLRLDGALGRARAVTVVARQPIHKAPGAEAAVDSTGLRIWR